MKTEKKIRQVVFESLVGMILIIIFLATVVSLVIMVVAGIKGNKEVCQVGSSAFLIAGTSFASIVSGIGIMRRADRNFGHFFSDSERKLIKKIFSPLGWFSKKSPGS